MTKNKLFGIVQGRLTKSKRLQQFPKNWKKEFFLLKKIGLSYLEILDERKFNNNNPINNNKSFNQINTTIIKSKSLKYSVCTDFIINNNLFGSNKKVFNHVKRLMQASLKYNFKIFILPLLEKSQVNKKNFHRSAKIIKKLSKIIPKKKNMILCLETLLSSKDLKFFIKKINEKKVKCVFDTGNRATISENLYKEILLLKNFIGHVHIKDKNKKNENVILGTGLVNFNDIFKALKKIKYKNKFTFETTRGTNPIETAKYNINFCKFFIKNNNYK